MTPDKVLRELKSSTFSKSSIRKIKLFYLEGNGSDKIESELREWAFQKKAHDDLDSLAREIHDCAQSVTDEVGKKCQFTFAGYDSSNKRKSSVLMKQIPEKEDDYLEASPEGQILQSMKHTEAAYRMVSEVLSKQAAMQRDLMESYHKRMSSLEKREDILSEIVREFRDLNQDHEDKIRREDRIERFLEKAMGYLAPAAAEKMMTSGLISAETAAGISAAGKEIAEEISEERNGGENRGGNGQIN